MLKYNKRHYPAIAPIDVDLDYTLIEDFLWENYDRWQNNFEAHKGLAVASNNIASDTYKAVQHFHLCLLYTSPSPRDKRQSRMPSSA